MELSLIKMHSIYSALSELSTNKELKAKTSFVIMMNMRALKPFVESFENARISLFKKYGEEKDGKFSISPTSEQFEKFKAELEDLTITNNNVELKKIDFSQIEDLQIDVKTLDSIFELLEFSDK